MMAVEAVEQIRDTIFKPGWRFRASSVGLHRIKVELFVDTVNTSFPGPDGQYRVAHETGDEREIDTYGLDSEALCYELLKMAAYMDTHENREFMRVRQPDGSWKAPLHPHNAKAELRWGRLAAKDPDATMDRATMVAALLDEILAEATRG